MSDAFFSYYDDFISNELKKKILKDLQPVDGTKLLIDRTPAGLESTESLLFLQHLFEQVRGELNLVLSRRMKDRKFIDERTRALNIYNNEFKKDYRSSDYKTIFGMEDAEGRIVLGPKRKDYATAAGAPVADIPEFLAGTHVTLFGPPDSAKLAINAMNAYHRKLKDEPKIVEELLSTHESVPKWGADDEDSKTPLHADLISAGVNLTKCFDGTLKVEEASKSYVLENEKLSLPIKRFPGLALPCLFLFYEQNPIPLHLYDFALHFWKNWHNPKALTFYVPKLENEEEARYIRIMMESAEKLIQKIHPEYQLGTIRLMIVLENPRAVFRVNEIMDELYPYFVGASLGWHDYLASTARLFKEDPNYRIPVKADPDIVIKYIKASHDLLADVVGPRGGIKVGGMYGILPVTSDLYSDSYQMTIKGFIRDVMTQLKRNLSGFWVAHPDFVRLGLALVEGWKFHLKGDSSKLHDLVTGLLDKSHQEEILNFIHGEDIKGLDKNDPLYARSLIVADLKESDFISNNHPDEIRYNVFQSLQYITDWLAGRGCVALPAQIKGIPVRVMDDLATAERSRWEVWHEIYHQRFSLFDFLKIAHEEFLFIRKDLSNDKKIVQVKWDDRTSKWYPVAFKLMIKLMTDSNPVEFATQLLLPFTLDEIRQSEDPWKEVLKWDKRKFYLPPHIERFNYFFEICGCQRFASSLCHDLAADKNKISSLILSFSQDEIQEAAGFHGDIGENKKTLDHLASIEQAKVLSEEDFKREELRNLGELYKSQFGIKFLIAAAGKSIHELKASLLNRLDSTLEVELDNARKALLEITLKRLSQHPVDRFFEVFEQIRNEFHLNNAQISIINQDHIQDIALGEGSSQLWFEMASLSKPVACAFACEFFKERGIPLESKVTEFLPELNFQNDLEIKHLMNHSALNLHYVNGVPAHKPMPDISEFLFGNEEYKMEPIKVINPPGKFFKYSGAGFIVLEYLIKKISKKNIPQLTREFLNKLGMTDWTFDQTTLPDKQYADGFTDSGDEIEGGRKMFASFAAGAMGTSHAMAKFLQHMERAFHRPQGSGGLSHDTACLMLHGSDKGCLKFMNSLMGLGIFIVEAHDNKFLLHQGANDGFRSLFLHCFCGPDQGKGFVIVCNSEMNGVLFNSKIAQLLLQAFCFEGIDFDKFHNQFSGDSIPQEQRVNLGYKNLFLDAFLPTRAEKVSPSGIDDPLAAYNLCRDAEIIECSNDLFARAENMFSPFLPHFDPELFGKQGKIMDSWESVRHNLDGADFVIFKISKSSSLRYISVSTKFHTGNFAPEISLEGKDEVGNWIEILKRTPLQGHSELRLSLPHITNSFQIFRITQFPDGGLTRLGLYLTLPESAGHTFDGIIRKCSEEVPATKKPLALKFTPTADELNSNWASCDGEINLSSAALGAKILSATDEHYSPAELILSPYSPLNMFDGMESARSRNPDHFEEVVIQLAAPGVIHRVEIDFQYFVNNNPLEVSLDAGIDSTWISLVPRDFVKPFRGNLKTFNVHDPKTYSKIRLRTYPCGGLNRIKVYGSVTKNLSF